MASGHGQLRGEDMVLDEVFKKFDELDKRVLSEIKLMNQLADAARAATSGAAVESSAAGTAAATNKATKALSEQEKVWNELNRLKERNTQVSSDSLRQLAEERTKRSQLTKAMKEEAVLSSELTSAYTKLRKQRDQAANTLRDYIVSNKASNKEIRKAQKEFDTLNNKVKKADSAIGNFRDNVGNYGSAVGGIITLTRQLASAFGFYSAIQIGQEIYEQVKALDALKFGLEQVTQTQEAYNNAQVFLSQVADRSGADLLVLTRRYTNFLAAAKSTTLTLKQTQDIFENVVVAGSSLGRSTDDINGAIRALEQILSKGNVQAEELRGQLGERLPGAFQIMEKALGLAVGELNELLEVGGLLSVDAIPALTKGLEEAYNLDTIDRVENLAAAQGRLRNEFTRFLQDVESGGGTLTTVFGTILGFLTESVKWMRELNGGGVFQDGVDEANARGMAVALEAVNTEATRTNKTLKEAAEDLIPRYTAILNEYGEVLSDITNEQSRSSLLNFFNMITGKFDEQQEEAKNATAKIALYNKALETLKKIVEDGGIADDMGDTTEAAKTYARTLEGLREELRDLTEEREKANYDNDIAEINRLTGAIKTIEDRIKSLTGAYKANKEAREEDFVGEESITFAKALVKEFAKAKDEVDVGSEAWFFYSQQLDIATESLKEFQDQAAILGGDLSSLVSPEDLDFAKEVDDFLNNQGLDVVLADFANKHKLNKEEILTEYIDMYGRDFKKFKEYEENKLKALKLIEKEKLSIRQSTLDLADDLADAFLEMQIDRLEEEEDRQNEVFDSITNSKDVSEEQIAAAEEKREKNEERIAKEKEKRETQAFLFRQALAIADIFIADGIARANAMASTAAIIPYLPLGAQTLATLQSLIGTNTAIAIGAVLAQSLPKLFYKGKGLGDKYSGEGIWGELQREVKVGHGGSIEISPDGPSRTNVKSSDIIHPSVDAFLESVRTSGSETRRRIEGRAQRNSGRTLATVYASKDNSSSFDEQAMERVIRRAFAKARVVNKFNIYNDSKIKRVP